MPKNYNDIMIYEDKELQEDATHNNFLLVQKEGNRDVKRSIDHYKSLNLLVSQL